MALNPDSSDFEAEIHNISDRLTPNEKLLRANRSNLALLDALVPKKEIGMPLQPGTPDEEQVEFFLYAPNDIAADLNDDIQRDLLKATQAMDVQDGALDNATAFTVYIAKHNGGRVNIVTTRQVETGQLMAINGYRTLPAELIQTDSELR